VRGKKDQVERGEYGGRDGCVHEDGFQGNKKNAHGNAARKWRTDKKCLHWKGSTHTRSVLLDGGVR